MREFKVVVLGSGGVGKSALTVQFVSGCFMEKYDPTIEDFYRKEIEVDTSPCVLEILDTAGTEQFASMRDLYIRNGQGFVVVYSMTNHQTFQDIKGMKEQITRVKNTDRVPILLVANKTPQTAEEWKRVAQGFSKKWNFPNCIGAVDGKHILIRPPPDSGSFYYNYKGSHSIVLMAVSNADSNFIYVDVGTNGRVSDGGVWGNCSLNQRIEAGSAGMPDDEVLPNSSKILPYVIVADDAFPLKRHIMKPFSHQNQNLEQRVFSYRLSRARRTVENAFGILAKRFEVFHKAINLEPKKVEKIVLACTALHNYLRKAPITPTLCSDANIENADEILGMLPLEYEEHTTINGTIVRNLYMKYFNEEGTVIWQNRHT